MTPVYSSIERLRGQRPAVSEVRSRHGTPRLFVNGVEVFPLLAWSWLLEPSAYYFMRGGIEILHPILGLDAAWSAPDMVSFELFERHFDALLAVNPDAYFLPRVLLDVPQWWKDQHPDELVKTAVPTVPKNPRQYRPLRINPEGGMAWGIPLEDASLASDSWRDDMSRLLGLFLEFIESSPLSSRIIGYQIGGGIYGEWHYPISEFLPDCSQPAIAKLGPAPSAEDRLATSNGLLRDPVKERAVISYYRRLHSDVTAKALLHFAALTKAATSRRVVVGSFQTYLLENAWIQEGGHLAPREILDSADIDFIASPYSYQTTTRADRPWFEHDVFDDAGNYLGRARGIGGDGGYRVLFESLRRAGKLFFVEIDPSTYLEPHPDIAPDDDIVQELPLMGGVGSTSPEGTDNILRRDVGRVLVSGCGGWLFDFGPTLATRHSWYADEPIIHTIKHLTDLGRARAETDLSPVAEIAAVYDYRTPFYTRHWLAEAPFHKGMANLDFVSGWFVTSQTRVFHRLGAPIDFLYHFDLKRADLDRYRLVLVPNLFYLSNDELAALKDKLEGSGVTVVWYYGPGILSNTGMDVQRTSALTGIQLEIDHNPGKMMIASSVSADEPAFGASQSESPRLVVDDARAEILGTWVDTGQPAFARKSSSGMTSVFVGAAPIPVETLRRLAQEAGVRMWSSQSDIVVASKDWAMLVATSKGERKLRLHRDLYCIDDGSFGSEFNFDLGEGEVRLFGPHAFDH